MTGFTLYCSTSGATVPVTIIYDKQYDTTGWKLLDYNETSHTYAVVPGAVFGTTSIGGVTKTTVTYDVTDGGKFDDDGVANGVIEDPVVPVTPLVTSSSDSNSTDKSVKAPNTGYGEPQQLHYTSSLSVTSAAIFFAVAGLKIVYKIRRDKP